MTDTLRAVASTSFVRLPVSAIRRAFGDWMWFIHDADGMPIAQIMPSTNEAMCKELVRLINLGASEPNVPALAQSGGEKTSTKESNS